MTDGSVSVPMILSGLKRRNARGTILQTDLLNKASTVCLKTTKFGRVTRAWRGVFLGVRHVPTARKRSQHSNFGGSLLLMHIPFDAVRPNMTW